MVRFPFIEGSRRTHGLGKSDGLVNIIEDRVPLSHERVPEDPLRSGAASERKNNREFPAKSKDKSERKPDDCANDKTTTNTNTQTTESARTLESPCP
jgi:hypothetical protein